MTLLAGSAAVDVTPDRPVPMSGYASRDGPSSGVHDLLTGTALVVDDGATTVAIVSVDLLNVSRPLTSALERRLADEGIHLDELVLAATHTHGGPYVPAPALDVHPTLSVEADVSGVVETLERNLAEAVATAHERREPASLRVGTAADDGTIVNRRRDLGARLPSSAVDRAVTALLVEGASGAETILFNLACHPVCTTGSNTLLTADWPGVARREIKLARDGEPTVLFCNGAAGDVTTRDRNADSRRGDDAFSYATEMGAEFAETVLEAVANAESGRRHDRGPIVTDRRELRLPVKSTPPMAVLERRDRELEGAVERLRADGHDDAAAQYDREWGYVRELQAIADWNASHLPARLQYVEVGPVGLVSVPGEAFVQHGLEFAAAADTDTLLTVGYATDYVGYLPTLSALENWGYEVLTTKVAPEGIVAFRDAGIDLLSASTSSRTSN